MMLPRVRMLLTRLFIAARSGLWPLPAAIVAGCIGLALALVEVDHRYQRRIVARWPDLFATDPEGARAMLSAIAGAMATVAGVVFSITIVVLALASSQYSPRALRNFMRDRITQTVLGVFVGLYLYCLLVLRTARVAEPFVPAVSALAGLLLALVAMSLLIYFIHNIARSIQATELSRAITVETLAAIAATFPPLRRGAAAETEARDDGPGDGPQHPVASGAWGYIQSIDFDGLLAHARRRGTILRLHHAVGDFVPPGATLLTVAGAEAPSRKDAAALNALFSLATSRTIEQDVAYGFRQLVDIALKALSPSINDTTTAVGCIDYLSVLLEACAGRDLAPPHRRDGGVLRVVACGPDFAGLAELACNQIIENAEGNSAVLAHLLLMTERIARPEMPHAHRDALLYWIDVIGEVAARSARTAHAARGLERRLAEARSALRTAAAEDAALSPADGSA